MGKTNITNETQDAPVSETVESLKDLEHSTVDLDSYKGRPTIAFNKQSKYPWSFGELKAKIIVKHFAAIKKFVESGGRSIS